jgi:hypothetical protein
VRREQTETIWRDRGTHKGVSKALLGGHGRRVGGGNVVGEDGIRVLRQHAVQVGIHDVILVRVHLGRSRGDDAQRPLKVVQQIPGSVKIVVSTDSVGVGDQESTIKVNHERVDMRQLPVDNEVRGGKQRIPSDMSPDEGQRDVLDAQVAAHKLHNTIQRGKVGRGHNTRRLGKQRHSGSALTREAMSTKSRGQALTLGTARPSCEASAVKLPPTGLCVRGRRGCWGVSTDDVNSMNRRNMSRLYSRTRCLMSAGTSATTPLCVMVDKRPWHILANAGCTFCSANENAHRGNSS